MRTRGKALASARAARKRLGQIDHRMGKPFLRTRASQAMGVRPQAGPKAAHQGQEGLHRETHVWVVKLFSTVFGFWRKKRHIPFILRKSLPPASESSLGSPRPQCRTASSMRRATCAPIAITPPIIHIARALILCVCVCVCVAPPLAASRVNSVPSARAAPSRLTRARCASAPRHPGRAITT